MTQILRLRLKDHEFPGIERAEYSLDSSKSVELAIDLEMICNIESTTTTNNPFSRRAWSNGFGNLNCWEQNRDALSFNLLFIISGIFIFLLDKWIRWLFRI